MMTKEELEQYATVPMKAAVFFKDFFPDGYTLKRSFKQGTYIDDNNRAKKWVTFQVKIFKTDDNGKKHLISNAFAREEQGSSEFNEINYFMTAQTRAEGRAYSGLGILIGHGIASREEVESSESFLNEKRKEERVARAPKVKVPDTRASLKRLRVKFEEKDDAYIIESYKGYSEKTMLALKKYGFQEVNNQLICGKVVDGN